MALQIKIFEFNAFQENMYILYDETNECVIIDPGCSNKNEEKILTDFIEEKGLHPTMLINTHCHIDHVLGNQFVAKKYDLSLFAHELEKQTLLMQPLVAQMYGLPYDPSPQISGFLKEGEEISFGNSQLKILFVPGHAPGHICLLSEVNNICIVGDTLFAGSIGRTDLPGGDYDTLISRIKSELFSLDKDTVIYPGHGGSSTIGRELRTNPFFK
ncbi:MAG TPA: MBL fold metallo-hydrolase [Saprospiraceae bacterium]|mgnify:CR=1 FL=1|nr:MBL fold metallo-hydrolase [Saprospiraceae bacterium]HPN70855.1 MBL fold metallo-hydrolase [Saprospiraceae bacterium]